MFFFFKKYDFRSIFLQKVCFFVFDFCAIFEVIFSKNFFFVYDFRGNFSSIVSLRCICLRKQRWGTCITHSPKRGKSAVFAEFHEFLSPPQKKRIFLDRSFRIYPLKNCFFCSQNQVSFFFSGIKNSYAEKSAVFAKCYEFLSSPKLFLG